MGLFDLAAAKEIEQLPALGTDVWIVVYSPDGTLLASGSQSGKIRVWSCVEHRLVRELDDHKDPVLGLYFRAGGRQMLSADTKGKAIWWDVLTWQAGRTFVVEPARWIGRAVSPGGRLLAAADTAGGMRWLNGETGELLATTPGRADPQYADSVAFSGDGSQVASVSMHGTVALWNPSSFQLIDAFQGHMQGAHGVAFSPDGHRLATGGGTDRDAVKLWDLSTRRELMTLSGQPAYFIGVGKPCGRPNSR